MKILVNFGADMNIKCCGTPNLHLALATSILPGGETFGLECFAYLFENSSAKNVKVND